MRQELQGHTEDLGLSLRLDQAVSPSKELSPFQNSDLVMARRKPPAFPFLGSCEESIECTFRLTKRFLVLLIFWTSIVIKLCVDIRTTNEVLEKRKTSMYYDGPNFTQVHNLIANGANHGDSNSNVSNSTTSIIRQVMETTEGSMAASESKGMTGPISSEESSTLEPNPPEKLTNVIENGGKSADSNSRVTETPQDSVATSVPTTETATAVPVPMEQEPWISQTSISPQEELFRDCTSPERDVPWLFDNGDQHAAPSILNPHLRCGLGVSQITNSSRFVDYFRDTIRDKIIRPILEEEQCTELVVYGAAFGGKFVGFLSEELHSESKYEHIVNSDKLIKMHGKCFFMFVHPSKEIKLQKRTMVGHYWLIPIPKKLLPFKNPRRNTKLLKYMGQLAFHNHGPGKSDSGVSPDHIIWQDAKFFRGSFIYSVPRNYSSVLTPRGMGDVRQKMRHTRLPCLTTMGLPMSMSSFNPPITSEISLGVAVSSYRQPRYRDHCQTIINALNDRPDVTDSPDALVDQCEKYLQYVEDQTAKQIQDSQNEQQRANPEINALDYGLIDSAFVIWKESTQECRDFNAALRCSMLDQLQCHSDRDQVLFPIVVHKLVESSAATGKNVTLDDQGSNGGSTRIPHSLQPVYSTDQNEKKIKLDHNWKPHAHDLELVSSEQQEELQHDQQVFLRVTRSSCHWYYYELSPNVPLGERNCGHRLWLYHSLEYDYPFQEQDRFIAKLSPGMLDEAEKLDDIDSPYIGNFHKCTSSDLDGIPWIFQSEIDQKHSSNSVTGSETPRVNRDGSLPSFHEILRRIVADETIQGLANGNCADRVVFGETLSADTEMVTFVLGTPIKDSGEKADRCRFLFVLEEHIHNITTSTQLNTKRKLSTGAPQPIFAGGHWLVPVKRETLPYKSMLRNSGLIKYSGALWFPFARSVIFQESKFFSLAYRDDVPFRPLRWKASKHPDQSENACVTGVALSEKKYRNDRFVSYCTSLINSFEDKTGKNDAMIGSLFQQCDAYIQFVYKRELTTSVLDDGFIDTNYLSWNQETPFCREFNEKFRWTILDQLHCHSDNDAVAFPFALYVQHQMALATSSSPMIEYGKMRRSRRSPVDLDFERQKHVLEFLQDLSPSEGDGNDGAVQQITVRILPGK